MLNRKIFDSLETWYKGDRAKAPLLDGARQVGKTTTIREFARRHYKHFIEINFVKRKSAKKAFDGDLDTHTIIMNLSAMGYGPFVKGETLVFFDEIQDCPGARTAIKFLMEEHEYDFIESGSLLGINYKGGEDEEEEEQQKQAQEDEDDIVASYPVGFEERINMYPLDFEEFLWAVGITQEVIDTLKECYVKRTPVPALIHEQMMKYFRQYLVVGGMPEAVQKFVTDEDFQKVVSIQKSIVDSYRDDISKYAVLTPNQIRCNLQFFFVLLIVSSVVIKYDPLNQVKKVISTLIIKVVYATHHNFCGIMISVNLYIGQSSKQGFLIYLI